MEILWDSKPYYRELPCCHVGETAAH